MGDGGLPVVQKDLGQCLAWWCVCGVGGGGRSWQLIASECGQQCPSHFYKHVLGVEKMAQLVQCLHAQTQGAEFNHECPSEGCDWCLFIILAPGRQRQTAPRGSLARQHGLIGKPQVPVRRDPVSRNKEVVLRNNT